MVAMVRSIAIVLISVMLLSSAGPLSADRGAGSLRVTVNPASIPADGKSVCTVSAEVRDQEGVLVPDGTEVRFNASLGVIEESVETSAGVARARLTSSDIPGDSVVTATWLDGQAVAQVTVSFGGTDMEPEGQQYLDINASDYLAYSMDFNVLEGIGSVRIRYRSLAIAADEAQVDLQLNRIVARSTSSETPVEIELKDKTITGDLLICDLNTLEGQLISISSGDSQRVNLLSGESSQMDEMRMYQPSDLEFLDLSESGVLVKAKSATVFPNSKIQFKGAGIYVKGKRTLYLPFYVLSLTGDQADDSQYLGYSTGGLTLNLPLYYSLTPSSSGALLVRHGESSGWGWYGQKPGWFLDVRQKYSTPNSSGQLMLSQITGNDWGAHFNHSQQLDSRTSGYMYVDWAAHKDLYGVLNLNRSYNSFSAGLNLYGTSLDGGGDSRTAELTLKTRSRQIGKLPARFTISSRTSYTDGSDMGTLEGMQQSLLGNVYTNPIKVGSAISMRASAGLGYLWGNSRSSGVSSLATAALDWKMSRHSMLQLNYRFADRATSYTSSTIGKQNLSAHLRLSDGKKWRATIFMMHGLDYDSLNMLGDFSYYLDKNWRLGLRTTYNKFGDISYNDTEFALGRRFENRELMAVWSKSQNKVMLELGTGAF